jgi:hypothetical protein
MEILERRLDGAMAEQELNGVWINARVEQVGAERMAQGMDVLPGMNAGVSIFATPSPIEGSRVAEEDIGRLGIEPGAPNAYPSPP